MTWLLVVGNFVGAFWVGYFLHVWDAKYTRLVARDYPLSREKMRLKVWAAIRWTLLMVLLAEADYASGLVFGREMLLAIVPGGLLGSVYGVYRVMWRKFDDTERRLAARAAGSSLEEEDDD